MAQATIEQMAEQAVQAAVLRVKQTLIPDAIKEAVAQAVTKSRDGIFPVGSYWITEGSQNPGNLFGGEWKKKGQGRCLWGADDAHPAGSEIEPGLPNITGTAYWSMMAKDTSFYASGALYRSSVVGNERSRSGGGTTGPVVGFDASRSNSIYGRSSTVQPPALVVNIWVRIA